MSKEREERLARIAEVYPEAAAEAVLAGLTMQQRIDKLEAELALLRAENHLLRKQRALLLESQTYWRSAAGGEC